MNKNEKFVITINREAGSGGRTVGRKLAEKLGVKYCDKAIVEGLTKKFGLSIERIEEIKAQKKSWWNDINNYYNTLVNSANLQMDAQEDQDGEYDDGDDRDTHQDAGSQPYLAPGTSAPATRRRHHPFSPRTASARPRTGTS